MNRLTASLATIALLAPALVAHDGDPKLLCRKPIYAGAGWRNAQRRGTGGNLEATAPGMRFPKSNVTLFSWVTLAELGVPAGGNGNSCYGYTSPSGREYAILGTSSGTAFIEVTQPGNPVIVAQIAGPNSLWRDVRTYSNYCYAVSEGGGGIQVMNLANIDSGSVTSLPSVNDDATSSTHTLCIDAASGYLYRSGGGTNGLRIYSLANPAAPARVGTWNVRYSHEVSVFRYTSGPAAGKEIAYVCGGLNSGFQSTGLYVVDVTNKAVPVQLQYVTYPNATYAHQCWPSADMQWLYLDDEIDDLNQTRVFNISNPLSVSYVTNFANAPASSIDHNLTVRGNLIFESNYRSGLRVKSNSNPGTPTAPVEVAFFDTWPEDNDTIYNGLWNNYPWFPSGTVIGSDIEKGLFVWWVGTPQITFTPARDPDTISPGGQTLQVQIGEIAPGTLVAGTAKLHYSTGGAFTAVNLVAQGGGSYTASLPATPCGTVVRYYYSGQSTNGIVWSEPEDAPEVLHQAVSATTLPVSFGDDFETNLGWVAGAPGDNATQGVWVRVNPTGTAAQPEDDHSTSGTICWVTGSSNDVDAGKTTLTSPTLDLSGLSKPILRYWRWYSNSWRGVDVLDNSVHPSTEVFRVDVSNNNGSSWVNVETVGPSGLETIGGWNFHQFAVSQFVAPTSQVKVRFVAQDLNTSTEVEAAIDDFEVVDADCTGTEAFCFGDGTGAPCPCGNQGGPGAGCDNSDFTGGAILSSTGTASVSADTLVLTSTAEKPSAFSLFLQGDQEIAPVNFGDGLRCAGGALKRLYSHNAVGGTVSAPQGADPSITARSAALGDAIPANGTRIYHVYYRDPVASFCPDPPGSTFNASNGLRVLWAP